MKEVLFSIVEKRIMEFSAFHWQFWVLNAPWQNGCLEALMKSGKNSIKVAIGAQRLSFTEMQTVMFSSANLVKN